MIESTIQALDLERLHELLVREDMAHNPETWITLYRVLALCAANGDISFDEPQRLASKLGPVVCKNPQHQQRILSVVQEWLVLPEPIKTAELATSIEPDVSSVDWRAKLKTFRRQYTLAALVLLVSICASIGYRLLVPPDVVVQPLQPPSEIDDKKSDTRPVIESTNIQIQDWINPNPAPQPFVVPETWRFWNAILSWSPKILPIFLLLVWLGWRYLPRTVIRNQTTEFEQRISGLSLRHHKAGLAPFTGPEMDQAVSNLAQPQSVSLRSIDEAATVSATANNFGLPTPIKERRPIHPQYLFLVQARHSADHVAELAETLVNALMERRIKVRSYRFADDPRYLVPWLQPPEGGDYRPLSLKQLADKRGDFRLVIVSDWQILFEPYRGEQSLPWVKQLASWQDRCIWLNPGFNNRESAEQAAKRISKLRIPLFPLSKSAIHDLARWLSHGAIDTRLPADIGAAGDDLPPVLSQTIQSWLDWTPPIGIQLKTLRQQLQSYLGADGLLLLQAIAVFPCLEWPWPQIIDSQLFDPSPKIGLLRRCLNRIRFKKPPIKDTNALRHQREQRLLKLGRLPWFRQAFMPDYLREFFFKQAKRKDQKKIIKAWQAIVLELNKTDGVAIDLPVALPENAQWQIGEYLPQQPEDGLINDAIFANILLGNRLGILDFRLPQVLADIFPGANRWLNLRPALLGIGIAASLIYGGDWAWQQYGAQALTAFWQDRLWQQNRDWQVDIQTAPQSEALASLLTNRLQNQQFATVTSQNQAVNSSIGNTVRYPMGGLATAQQVAETLRWLTYSGDVRLEQTTESNQQPITVVLNRTFTHKAAFRDELRLPWQKEDRLAYEPEIIVIPPGWFLMGTPDSEDGRDSDEGPQHQVTIAKPFAIGKTEVTFVQYDAFAEATGRKKPDDNGWGRGNRPVINVSFDDAQAYAKWLSDQTGKQYRLPTEAEWEYAARAGTTTPFHSGNCISTAQANYDGNYDYNGCGAKTGVYLEKTQEVGKYPANVWGLNDTAGNVWEWTEDCWHDNYTKEQTDGSQAWLEADQGDCTRRVVRGGSWDDRPGGLRSAGRNRSISDAAVNDLGFRVARAL